MNTPQLSGLDGYEVVSARHAAVALQRAYDRGHIKKVLNGLRVSARVT